MGVLLVVLKYYSLSLAALVKDPEGHLRKAAGIALLKLAPLRCQTAVTAALAALDDIYPPVREVAVRLLEVPL